MTETQSVQILNERFGIPQTVRFEEGPGGLARAVVTGDAAAGEIFLYGAHVAEYQPIGRRNLLFMSKHGVFREGEPLRGGVPICFPWFGPKGDDPNAPLHGAARVRIWELLETRVDGDAVVLALGLRIEPYELRYEASFGPELKLSLNVTNRGQVASRFEEGLHTYLSVSQVRNVEITGLEGVQYLDKTEDYAEKRQGDEPIRIEGETDRVYQDTDATCVLHDRALGRRIVIEKENSLTTVVWNPWRDKARQVPDLGEEEWPDMVCIETVNAKKHAVELGPGQTHTMTARIRAESL